ncbi:head GIN domain-containing protein [Pseudonocardia sp. TRM90224]|uniref:head GIN domain-containing protein n=1 Tax=Pseudonocardia sp. TRM90224 TaxID=2812678 RepID=UPI001E47F9C6|nr:head GIN domain-containing protein [Pseudonocardia sp. TRM90224]
MSRNKIAGVLLSLLSAAVLVGCGNGVGQPGLTGNGSPASGGGADGGSAIAPGATSEPRQVSGFTGVKLSTSGELRISHTGTESLTIEAEAAVLPKLTSEVVDGKLLLGIKPNESYSTRVPVVYKLTVKDLTSLAVAGSGKAIDTQITGDRFELDLDGSGDITAGGTVRELIAKVTGSGDLKADALVANVGSVVLDGSGDATVKVSDKLDAKVSGSGSLTYLGNPALTKDVRGSGDITKG